MPSSFHATTSSRAAAPTHWLLWQQAMDLAEVVLRATGACSTVERFGLAQVIRHTTLKLPPLVSRCPPVATKELLADLHQAQRLAEQLETTLLLVERLSAESPFGPHRLLDRLSEFQHLLSSLLSALQPSLKGNRTIRRSGW